MQFDWPTRSVPLITRQNALAHAHHSILEFSRLRSSYYPATNHEMSFTSAVTHHDLRLLATIYGRYSRLTCLSQPRRFKTNSYPRRLVRPPPSFSVFALLGRPTARSMHLQLATIAALRPPGPSNSFPSIQYDPSSHNAHTSPCPWSGLSPTSASLLIGSDT